MTKTEIIEALEDFIAEERERTHPNEIMAHEILNVLEDLIASLEDEK